jgi:hypothetical protein
MAASSLFRSAILPGLMAAALVLGCRSNSNDSANTPLLSRIGTIASLGTPGERLADTLTVGVTEDGIASAGARMTWRVEQGGGTIEPIDSVTDAGGYARATWVLGSTGTNRVSVFLKGASVAWDVEAVVTAPPR